MLALTVVSQEEHSSNDRDKVQRQTQNVSDDPVDAHEPFPAQRLGDGLSELGDLASAGRRVGSESAVLDQFSVVLGEKDLRA